MATPPAPPFQIRRRSHSVILVMLILCKLFIAALSARSADSLAFTLMWAERTRASISGLQFMHTRQHVDLHRGPSPHTGPLPSAFSASGQALTSHNMSIGSGM